MQPVGVCGQGVYVTFPEALRADLKSSLDMGQCLSGLSETPSGPAITGLDFQTVVK